MSGKISIDVDSLVKTAIKNTLGTEEREPRSYEPVEEYLHEAYVAEPKKFKQVSDSISQKTKDAHIELYSDYIKSLNQTSAALDSAPRDDVNPRSSKFRSLKVDETYNMNAVYLHELYFSNCFDPNSEIYMDSMPYIRLQRDFGSFEDWQQDFISCALASNQGWAVCSYNFFLKRFVNSFIDLHSNNVQIGIYPVIVLDMWDHSSYRDYLSDKRSYIVNQMKELNWNIISERFEKVEKLIGALR